jgi:hypothetical protein
MGIRTDEAIRDFQRRAGIEPPTKSQSDTLKTISETAHELVETCIREQTGIRDGDGAWHGSDPVDGLLSKLTYLQRVWGEKKSNPSSEEEPFEEPF